MGNAVLSPQPKFTPLDSNGDPYVGGKLYTYETGTTTPKTTWTSADKSTANANPVVLDSKGQADVWIDSSGGNYRFVLEDANGNTVWTIDDISAAAGSGSGTAWTSSGGVVYPTLDTDDVYIYNNQPLVLCDTGFSDNPKVHIIPYSSSTGYSILGQAKNLASEDYIFYAHQTFDDTTPLTTDRVMYNFFSNWNISAGQADLADKQTVFRGYMNYVQQSYRGSTQGYLARNIMSGTNDRSIGVKDATGFSANLTASGSGGMISNEFHQTITGDNIMRGLDITVTNNYGTGGVYFGWINDPAGFTNTASNVGLWIRSTGTYEVYHAIAIKGDFKYAMDVNYGTISTCGINLADATITSSKAIAIAYGDHIDLSGDTNPGQYYIRRQASTSQIQFVAGGSSVFKLSSSQISALKNLSVTGNISVTGTVDGVDISSKIDQDVRAGSSPSFYIVYASGNVSLTNNARYFYGRTTGGTYKILIGMNSSNYVTIGNSAVSHIDIGSNASLSNPLYIRVNGVNSKNVTVGAADSGGAGYRVLRVPN